MEKVTFTIVSAEQDYSAMMKYNMFQKKKILPVTVGGISLLSIVALLGSYLHIFPIPRFLYIMSLIWLLLVFILVLSIKKSLKNTSKASSSLVGRAMEFEVDETGILERDAETESEIKFTWAEGIFEVNEIKDYIFIYVSRNQAFIIPKNQLERETLDNFKTMLKLYGPSVTK
ncbi:MAG: YcxB family protein [Firmicutes bacterium]|nr:YcxB family protein [Bacillota bacterium]